jgi:methylenetetrahydrofolate reductase (NADPH)
MKKICEIFSENKQTFSLEFFPPKTPEGYEKLLGVIGFFAKLKPDFISCTYGAGGGSREKTLDIVEHITKTYNIPSIAHLTCVLNTKTQIRSILEDIKQRGIRNVLALRGDPPLDDPNWQPTQENFQYAYELCQFIKKTHGNEFCIGVAGFPEGHILCPNKDLDAKYLKMKIDAGADYVVTQLFFHNDDYFQYVDRLRKLGIKNCILPGVLPITDYHATIRFCERCGTSIPQKVHDIFAPTADNKETTIQKGIDLCVLQCQDLLKHGAPGIHFYPLNKIHPLDAILPQIKIS